MNNKFEELLMMAKRGEKLFYVMKAIYLVTLFLLVGCLPKSIMQSPMEDKEESPPNPVSTVEPTEAPPTSANRIFFEDSEATGFPEWFLERSMGSSDYWNELPNEITRSTDAPYSGNYCMTYDPWITANPHANTGIDTIHGNTSKFLLTDVHTDKYYFRWKHRWQTDVDYSGSAQNKNLYLGYHEWGGDFVLVLVKGGPSDFNLSVMKNPGYEMTLNKWPSLAKNLDDMAWHNMEVYIDLKGLTGPTGYLLVKIDGVILYEDNAVYYRDQININDGVPLGLIQWPSNTSGADPKVGNNRQWLDDLEIWDGFPAQ
ncbi:MAG: hypothetical protein A2504_12375 [Bdellovibrionales bacterium RIFOXYD12_FULL_39_22]|nr:MAG: hypothetical protein A2385_17910 [Bdellovibrionales bacterium RIFOXYB1_FULL_39_21]OFZ40703.1 MAG: hypothetical protein A2485_03685 [Bdellovibrionales bacterium RIFOXYC12_FULL_39_17]OFZ77280.1 MAG: hypothetical protein A2560_14880 [Bdellovibrionales bacterium RIFOXYD1_FULL_39_84]OFZ91825.1 MAG: hypothetical protein A2504_12375 [Bdellovibrionales bacterium RIFOXYD12_FULL_39_22]